ncbi:aspartate aminotransferase family protein [Risungbinella massiliensis]|uniref:aspartate aminotransferase family protein n=1 Tax=Risungbinella massiliensis TaxID=1329796 RepID=UPI0005CC85E7|nr:aminotransferase class III-fold pyridoxal phosphate-dependent enzyme [Risungbinella massiliensis]
MNNWQELDQQYVMHTVKRYPITIEKAIGNYLYDTDGKQYLDLFTGLAVNVLGHSHPRVMKALEQQGNKFLHISNLFLNQPSIQLAQKLVEHSVGTGKVFFCNSGAEATEAAIKLIHKWRKRQKNGRNGLVVLRNGFHGRTLGALRLTRQPGVYQDFPELSLPIYEVDRNSLSQLQEVCQKHRPAAVLVEPILGAGGVETLSEEFLLGIQEICQSEGMLLCIDEIQTGIGRTGKMFAYQHFAIEPDVILFAKGVGGGLPLGGIIAKADHADLFQPGDHGTTFAPSPLSAALGNAVIDTLLDGELEKGRLRAGELWGKLEMLRDSYVDHIDYLDGRGMMIGIRTHLSAEEVKNLHQKLLNRGILVNVTAGTVIRLLPPLTLTTYEIDEFLQAFRDSLDELIQEKKERQ